MHRRSGRIWAEISGSILHSAAADQDPRPILFNGNFYVWIILVIAKDDVIAGFVLFYQGGLEDEGLLFGSGQDGVDICRFLQHNRSFGEPLSFGATIGGQPVTQIPGLADIKNRAGFILHKVNTWTVRHRAQKFTGNRRFSHLKGSCLGRYSEDLAIEDAADHYRHRYGPDQPYTSRDRTDGYD